MRSWLLTDPRYNELEKVWLWEEFPGAQGLRRHGHGIDLVAKTEMGDYGLSSASAMRRMP